MQHACMHAGPYCFAHARRMQGVPQQCTRCSLRSKQFYYRKTVFQGNLCKRVTQRFTKPAYAGCAPTRP